ncbi:fructosamine kinase family protein [Erythrobacter sp. THAF29]|uniref:fructosamine kinase family protein n=1 Tax=Erythrobacter sp. THAF29 TaxID=2587851 RepID=UPI00126891D5|nr:fructosamine kinase family protein [Erythrobacter sp. THAF29]QFT77697.1 Fructosamine kinase [Erythrobacter sp. THAF29]
MTLDLAAIAGALGSPVERTTPLAGGDISGASRLTLADGREIVAKAGPLVEVEARMLSAIVDTGAPCPGVIATGEKWFAMEWIEASGASDRWEALADTLHLLHRPKQASFGWDEDYAFGPVAIANQRCRDWARFWAERRLLCHVPYIDSALGKRIARLCERIGDLLPAYTTTSLLHGDLWGGNVIWSDGNAHLIDPACYFGHREVDWAMLTLFDHPPENFFALLDPEPGWRERQPLYRLWPWLVHLRLFGGSYRGAVERELAALGF